MLRLSTLLRGSADHTAVQLVRYTLVGGMAYVVDFGSLVLLTEVAGLHYLLSAAVAFLLGLSMNYSLSIRWVFPQRRLANRWGEFAIFGLIGAVGLGLNEVIMWALTSRAGVHYLGSKLASTVVVYLWNFFARKYALFSRES